MIYKFIIGFCVFFYFLALVSVAWNFLSSKRLPISKKDISYQQQKRVVFLFALIFGVMVTVIILLLSFFAPSFIPFLDKFIFSSGEVMNKLSPSFCVFFLIGLLLIVCIFAVALSSWSRAKKGYALLFIGFGLYFLSILSRAMLINQLTAPSENIILLNTTFTLISIPVFILAAIMLLPGRKKGNSVLWKKGDSDLWGKEEGKER